MDPIFAVVEQAPGIDDPLDKTSYAVVPRVVVLCAAREGDEAVEERPA